MEIHFFGTSAGTPTRDRNVSAIAVKADNSTANGNKTWCLVDCGEGTQHQILRSKLSLNRLSAVFITHIHGDHCYGLPGLLASAAMTGRTSPLIIVAPVGIKAWIESTQQLTQLFLPYELHYIAVEELSEIDIGPFSITATELSHRVPSYAYSFTNTEQQMKLDHSKITSLGIPRGPLWGELIRGKDIEFEGSVFKNSDLVSHIKESTKVIICGDNDNPGLLKELATGCDVLVHEATYSKQMASRALEVGHSYAELVAKFAEECSIPNLILTHFSPRYGLSPKSSVPINELRDEAARCFSGALFLAKDFDIYQLDKKGSISVL